MLTIEAAALYVALTPAEEIAVRLVPYFYLYEYMGKPIKNYTFAISYCALGGPFSPVKLSKDEALLDLLNISNYGTTSPDLGSKIHYWAEKYISSEGDCNWYIQLANFSNARTNEIADIVDVMLRQVQRDDYLLGEMIPEFAPLGYLNGGKRWPRI